MSHIIRAEVITNSSDDPQARVKLRAAGFWDESFYVDSLNGMSFAKGDHVYVDISAGFENPLILGRSFDKQAQHVIDGIEGSILFESSDGTNWTIAYVKNDRLVIQNSSDTKIEVDGQNIIINEGTHGGLVNADAIRDMCIALLKDLVMAQSGSNLSKWMSTVMANVPDATSVYGEPLEDSRVTH